MGALRCSLIRSDAAVLGSSFAGPVNPRARAPVGGTATPLSGVRWSRGQLSSRLQLWRVVECR